MVGISHGRSVNIAVQAEKAFDIKPLDQSNLYMEPTSDVFSCGGNIND